MPKLPIRVSTLVGIAILTGTAWLYGRAAQSVQLELPGPPDRLQWVAFSAQLERITPNGARWVGRFYRGSDGSSRHETGLSLQKIERININNVSELTNYQWDPKKRWVSRPMDLPPGGWRPGSPSARLLASMTPSGSIEGFSVLRRDQGDYIEFVAPKLDMFPVKVLWKSCSIAETCGTWYTNIKVGEQPDELFQLPTGEPVVSSSEPGGIYRVK